MMASRTSRGRIGARISKEHAHVVCLAGVQAHVPRSVQVDILLRLGSLKRELAVFDHLKASMFEAHLQHGKKCFVAVDPLQMNRR